MKELEITALLTEHRIEHLPIFEEIAKKHEVIVLEEPYPDLISQVLEGGLELSKYVELMYTEFSRFLEEQYRVLARLRREGKVIYASEPYLAQLIKIYRYIEDRCLSAALEKDKLLRFVHNIENIVSKRLLEYYEAVSSLDFNRAVKALLEYAKADAFRILVRDLMRARELYNIVRYFFEKGYRKILIETGLIHIMLVHALSRYFPHKVHVVNTKRILAERCLPEENLDILEYSHPGYTITFTFLGVLDRANLTELAAQCIIYNMLISKDEKVPTDEDPCPHLREEYRILKLVSRLSFDGCRKLFERIMLKMWRAEFPQDVVSL